MSSNFAETSNSIMVDNKHDRRISDYKFIVDIPLMRSIILIGNLELIRLMVDHPSNRIDDKPLLKLLLKSAIENDQPDIFEYGSGLTTIENIVSYIDATDIIAHRAYNCLACFLNDSRMRPQVLKCDDPTIKLLVTMAIGLSEGQEEADKLLEICDLLQSTHRCIKNDIVTILDNLIASGRLADLMEIYLMFSHLHNEGYMIELVKKACPNEPRDPINNDIFRTVIFQPMVRQALVESVTTRCVSDFKYLTGNVGFETTPCKSYIIPCENCSFTTEFTCETARFVINTAIETNNEEILDIIFPARLTEQPARFEWVDGRWDHHLSETINHAEASGNISICEFLRRRYQQNQQIMDNLPSYSYTD